MSALRVPPRTPASFHTEDTLPKHPPAFQFYPSDFLSDQHVALMTTAEVGAYWLLLCYCWREGWLANDPKVLTKLVRMSPSRFKKAWPKIAPCFTETEDGKLTQKRLDKERSKQVAYRKERSEAGKKGAEARWQTDGLAITAPMAKDGSSSSSSSSSSEKSKRREAPAGATKTLKSQAKEIFADHVKVRGRWFEQRNGRRPKEPTMGPQVEREIIAAIQGHDYDAARACGRGCFLSSFHTGSNPEGELILDPIIVWRMNKTTDNVDKFSRLYFDHMAKGRKPIPWKGTE